MQNEALEL